MNEEVNANNTLTKAYEDDFQLLMPAWGYVAAALTLFIIGFFGFFLNLLVIVIMFKDRQLWTPLNIILFNLVCSDFSVSILGNPFTLISALYHRWVFGDTMCVMYGFFMALLGISSITTLTVLSFERYMLVSKPTNPRHLTPGGAFLMIVFIWLYSLALTTPPLFGWGSYVNEAADISCSINWEERTSNTMTYILFLFAFGQIIPVIVITFSYFNIIRTMKQNAVHMGQVNKAEARVTIMVLLMILAFMVAWTPYSICALLEQFAEEGTVSAGFGVIPALIAKSSICYNPMIYVGMNSQFRTSIKKLMGMEEQSNVSQTKDASILAESKIKVNFNVNLLPKVTVKSNEMKPRKSETAENKPLEPKSENPKADLRVILKTEKESANEESKNKRKSHGNITLSVHSLDENDCIKKTEILTNDDSPKNDRRRLRRITYQNSDENLVFKSNEEIVDEEIV